MANQRALVRMSEAEIQHFLSGPHTMCLSTVDKDGFIHSAAMWYALLDGQVAVLAKRRSQKVVNALRGGRLTGLVEDGTTYTELRGVCLIGTPRADDRPEVKVRVALSLFDRYSPDGATFDAQASTYNRIVLWIEPIKVASWDHAKLRPKSEDTLPRE
ncbi:pyridoxamine 5'-phosphate oxidase family protein [Jatrophihabitans cynanchi]|uniref:Pyridoxamine 5'-phosphate oxidase family protein n=1 Tax=Jatrophihabitans cynanchi TaxID=2944128 RepID=A0ABY7K387_9ACTN|nr:pyridoxamine 5'-phosphate oxidase family protein [Jatrophihabitans sp. SB3-54]WAX58363.1 pyridoxamine 5'-phosphate oxidase family protein [Jatrophihabitans sp. SB3-54]